VLQDQVFRAGSLLSTLRDTPQEWFGRIDNGMFLINLHEWLFCGNGVWAVVEALDIALLMAYERMRLVE